MQSRSPRPRSRSLSSSMIPLTTSTSDLTNLNTFYKQRFPKATEQMEECLQNFISSYTFAPIPGVSYRDSQPILRFVHHQVLEMARDCLLKSEGRQISSLYFKEMGENLERLAIETREKSPEDASEIFMLVRKLLLIVSRSARLLECLEFDPEEFYRVLEEEELGREMDLVGYISRKLCLKEENSYDENPLEESGLERLSLGGAATEEEIFNSTEIEESAKLNPPSETDFEIVKLISNGAYGAVYLVKNKSTRQRFALKKINKNNLILRNQVEQVFAERDILSFADNPFVVSMFCSFETKKHLCLVMEYVEGGDCATLLKNIGLLPMDMARFYFAETVLAVEYLHSFGIVHRDLKPDNLLITALGHIKLTDFGLSKMGLMSLATNLSEGLFSDKQVFGTPEYIAPEVILRQGYGKPVDWWALGIILYEFIIGCVPFFGATPEELFSHTVNDAVEWPREDDFEIPNIAREIIEGLLEQNPRERLGSGGAGEVKNHGYFIGIDWNSLLRQKAEFVPQLENEEDTSYFDSRMDRYNHEEEEETETETEETVFGTFSCFSPMYRKQISEFPSTPDKDSSFSSLFLKVPLTPDKENLNSKFLRVPSTPESDGKQIYPKVPFPINFVSNKTLSTPESSQTDSDDVSPQIQRKRKTTTIRPILPKFSISLESCSLENLSSSTASSRDNSPCREIMPFFQKLKPPISIRRGPRGFGFTVHTIRVYYGDSDFYTMHHLVMAVDEASPAFESGLRPADLITHVNNEPIQGLLHTQVLQLLFSSGDHVCLHATPLAQTSIQSGGRRRNFTEIRLARRNGNGGGTRQRKPKKERKEKTSLFRKISTKRASAESQPIPVSPPSSKTNPRPSTLHGLKHKIHPRQSPPHPHSSAPKATRRKSLGHIPLSPLARTPSPSPLPLSPTRSPSPLTFCQHQHHYQPGSSNQTQSYSPAGASRAKELEVRRAASPDFRGVSTTSPLVFVRRSPGTSQLFDVEKDEQKKKADFLLERIIE
ncbi:MAST4 family protein [Megaselia abdita]